MDWIAQSYFSGKKEIAQLAIKQGKKLFEESSPHHKIEVFETDFFGRVLKIDGWIMLTQKDEFVFHEIITHIPLLTLKTPRKMLVLGGGDCGILKQAVKYDSLTKITLCEVDPLIPDVAKRFFPFLSMSLMDPRVELIFKNPEIYIQDFQLAFDFIVFDQTKLEGASNAFFSVSFLKHIKRALSKEGVLVVPMESPWLKPAAVRTLFETLSEVFKNVELFTASNNSFPGGPLAWAYVTKGKASQDHFERDLAASLSKTTEYYNPSLQRAAFALPNFIKLLMGEKVPA